MKFTTDPPLVIFLISVRGSMFASLFNELAGVSLRRCCDNCERTQFFLQLLYGPVGKEVTSCKYVILRGAFVLNDPHAHTPDRCDRPQRCPSL